jgi:serine/threonine protein phosphatase 1
MVKETVQSGDKAQEELAPKRAGWVSRFLRREEKQHAAIPEGFRVYAVGDVHGRLDLLRKLWAMIETDAANTDLRKVVVFVGDYVDRGHDSKGVIDFLLEAKLDGGDIVCLRGNHDQAVLDFVADADFYRSWKPFGAPETLLSYGVMPPKFDDEAEFESARNEFVSKCPPEHFNFLESLPYCYELGGYFFVHAGVRPGIPLKEQDPQDMLWIRDEFLFSRSGFEKVIVYGHTPVEQAGLRGNRIGIDTGAYATGRLSAAVLEGQDCRIIAT